MIWSKFGFSPLASLLGQAQYLCPFGSASDHFSEMEAVIQVLGAKIETNIQGVVYDIHWYTEWKWTKEARVQQKGLSTGPGGQKSDLGPSSPSPLLLCIQFLTLILTLD